MLWVNCGIVAK